MTYKSDSAVTHIVVHYSATPIERDYTAADIDKMHTARGFKKIGYHYFIRKNGMVETGRDLSQPGRFEVGAHSKGENDESIGICYEGGVKASDVNTGFDSRTPAQIKAMIALIDQLQDRFPGAIVEGHRDMPGAATQCPGFSARDWWSGVVKARLEPLKLESPTKPHTGHSPVPRDDVDQTMTAFLAKLQKWWAAGGFSLMGLIGAVRDLDPTVQIALIVMLGVAGVFGAAVLSSLTRRERLKHMLAGVR